MVQASTSLIVQRDLPQALVLLNEMNVSVQHVTNLVDSMIQKVKQGELSTDQGLSFLEVKYNMLLSYLINLTYVVLRKSSGEQIENDPSIDRLIEIRTVLEKMRPINHKLKYQIDKLVKTAVTGVNADSATAFKPNAANMLTKEGFESSDSESGDESAKPKPKTGVYLPPKLSAVHYESAQEKTKRLQEKSKKVALSSSILQDLREEYLDTPVEISQGSRAQQILSKEQKERQEYEEEYMTRLPVSKADKHRKRQLTTLGSLGDEVTSFGSKSTGGVKRKQKGFKSKGKNVKRKKFH